MVTALILHPIYTIHSMPGVDVDALEAAAAAAGKQDKGPDVARSDRAILIKNLPWSTSEDELQSLFAESGERVVGVTEGLNIKLCSYNGDTRASSRSSNKTVVTQYV